MPPQYRYQQGCTSYQEREPTDQETRSDASRFGDIRDLLLSASDYELIAEDRCEDRCQQSAGRDSRRPGRGRRVVSQRPKER
jgi:hypothetical protein